MASRITLITIAILFIFPVSFSSPTTTSRKPPRFSKIYAFGDSYTDTGNRISGFPYGITFFHHRSNRFSDGRLVIDFVTEALSLPYLTPYLHQKNNNTSHGVNFAVAGATAIDNDFFVKNNITLNLTPQSLRNELVWFDKFLDNHGCVGRSNRCSALMHDALFWVGQIGFNDYVYILDSSVSPATVQHLALKSVTDALQALLKRGAKYIVVQGLPMTGCLSSALSIAATTDRDDFGCVASANKQSYTYNLLLQTKLRYLRKQYPHAVISYADHWNAYRAIMKNQQGYGFKEPFKACCGAGTGPYHFEKNATCGFPMTSHCSSPAQYINWDGFHLTESMYKVVADLFLWGGYSSPSLNTMLSSQKGTWWLHFNSYIV